jgi:hypothetical protein
METAVQEQPCYQLGSIEACEGMSAVEVPVPLIGQLMLNDAQIKREKDGSILIRLP